MVAIEAARRVDFNHAIARNVDAAAVVEEGMKYCHGFVAGHIDFVKNAEAAPRSAFIDRTGTELDFPVFKGIGAQHG